AVTHWLSLLFFFSSRRRHTRFSRDWSSDVCSSDLAVGLGADHAQVRVQRGERIVRDLRRRRRDGADEGALAGVREAEQADVGQRSEERRVGKECRWRWARVRQQIYKVD